MDNGVLSAIGDTPLIKLERAIQGNLFAFFAKL
jgi:hypothetical protein